MAAHPPPLRLGLVVATFLVFDIEACSAEVPDTAPESTSSTASALLTVAPADAGPIGIAACPCTDITASTGQDGHVEILARSAADGSLWRAWESGPNGSYYAWNTQRLTQPAVKLGWFTWPAESIEDAPTAATARVDGKTHVFYVRSSTHEVVEAVGAGEGSWPGYTTNVSHGGPYHDPAALHMSSDQLAVFAVGNDGQVWLTYQLSPGAAWTGWSHAASTAPFQASGRPSTLQYGDGSIWLFVRDTGGGTWYASAPALGQPFSGWTSLGGYMQFPATAALDANGLINLVGVGGDGQVWLDLQNEWGVSQTFGFGGWTPLVPGSISTQGASNSAPVIGTNTDGRLGVFFTNSTNSLWGVEQCGPGTWWDQRATIAQPGGFWWAPNSAAVAGESDGRLVGFGIDQGRLLHYARLQDPLAETPQGKLVGRNQCGASVFKGVPYAVPPTPANHGRWQAPVQPPPYTAYKDAGSFGPWCMQWNPYTAPPAAVGSEDCLYLNVFSPLGAAAGPPLPVMVFIHGGGDFNGSAAEYDATALVNRATQIGSPVVVVTINYRLNAFGFLAYPGLTNGNLGLQDQIAALKWVKQNIGVFGGDPARVTIFGQSAGGLDTRMLMASPAAAGLFWAAGIESTSGGYGVGLPDFPTANDAMLDGQAFAAGAGCPAGGGQLACLLALPAGAIVAAAIAPGAPPIQIDVDGTVLPTEPKVAFAQNAAVPLLVGSNHDEVTILAQFGDDPNVLALDGYTWNDFVDYATNTVWWPAQGMGQQMLAWYSPSTPVASKIALDTDLTTTCPLRAMLRVVANKGLPVYRYLFTHALQDPNATYGAGTYAYTSLGAFHSEELTFLYRGLGKLVPGGDSYRGTAQEWGLSDEMIAYWTRFATTRNPNGSGPGWPTYPPGVVGADPEMVLDVPTHFDPVGYDVAPCDFVAPYQ